jgi:3-hydroxyisobutyrate dehydrogenase-like beta-hydroxyacid dehydrogenase
VKTIGFLGTGLMGGGMARTLARKGYAVTAFNRTRSRLDALDGSGVVLAASPADAARGADVLVCMLSEAPVLESLLASDGLAGALRPGMYVIDASTSGPSDARALAQRLSAAGVAMLDAPVFGSKDSAEAGELTFVVGGERSAFDTCLPLFGAMGQRSFYVGRSGSGCMAKLGFNLVIAGTLQSFSEALALTANHVEPQQMVEIIMAGRARSGIIEMKAPRILARDYTAFFPLKHMEKDVRLMTEAARELGLTLPLTETLRAIYASAVASGFGEQDFCSVFEWLQQSADAART